MYNKAIINNYSKIYKIPYNLSQLNYLNTNNSIRIIGYKKIYSNINVPIIELNNFIRIWLLPNEIY